MKPAQFKALALIPITHSKEYFSRIIDFQNVTATKILRSFQVLPCPSTDEDPKGQAKEIGLGSLC